MILYSYLDSILSPSTSELSATLGEFMTAYSNTLTDQYPDDTSSGSNWQKLINPVALAIDEFENESISAVNHRIDSDSFIHNTYTLVNNVSADDITAVTVYNNTSQIELSKAEYVWDFIYGVPCVEEFAITIAQNSFDMSHRISYDASGERCINYITINNVDVTNYTITDNDTYSNITFSTDALVGDTVKFSYRTHDCFYYDDARYIIYLREQYDSTGTGNVFFSDGTSWYPQTPSVDVGNLPEYQQFWNRLDSLGLLCDTPRLLDEEDTNYRERIRDAFIYPSGTTQNGIRNILGRRLDLIQHDTWTDDKYDVTLNNIWEDSLRIDYRPIDSFSFEFLGISAPDLVVEDSLRVYRNGILKHDSNTDSSGTYDYDITNDVIVFNNALTSDEIVVIDYLLKTGSYYKLNIFSVPSGQIDGTNNTFTLPTNQIIGTVQVYHNLLRNASGIDYNEYDGYIIMKEAPAVGDIITIVYYTDEEAEAYEWEHYVPIDTIDGANDTFTIPSGWDKLFVFRNGGYLTKDKDYTEINTTQIQLIDSLGLSDPPDADARIEVFTVVYNTSLSEGAEYEQFQFQMLEDGCCKWYLGTKYPATEYTDIYFKLQYNGSNKIIPEHLWVTSHISTDSKYASDSIYANTIEFEKNKFINIENDTTTYVYTLEPQRNGWEETIEEKPDDPLGYIPYHPEMEIQMSYENLDRTRTDYIFSGDILLYKIRIRNIGNIYAENVTVTMCPPPYYRLSHNGGGNFTLACDTKRGLSHDLRYIYTSRWSNSQSDSINVFPIWDRYYAPRLFFDDEGFATNELKAFAKRINDKAPILWGNGKWDESIWDSYTNVYGEIYTDEEETIYTKFHDIEANKSQRYNYSFIPHRWDAKVNTFPQTDIDGISRRLDFQSGIGWEEDLKLTVDTDEYETLSNFKQYKFPVYVNTGNFYVNDIESYQFANMSNVVIDASNPLGASNEIQLPTDTNTIYAIINDSGNTHLARKTCFYDNTYSQTHIKTETLKGNGINKKLFTEFTNITILSLTYNSTATALASTDYTITDNEIELINTAEGVYYTTDNEYIIDYDDEYTVTYTLNYSYYIDDNYTMYFDSSYSEISILYDSSEEYYNTGIIMNPLYSPHTQKFVYAELASPVSESIECWCSPLDHRAGTDEPLFVTAELMSKEKTPIEGATVDFTSSDGQTFTGYTNKFGRVVWVYTNSTSTSGTTITFTVTGDSLTDTCTLYIY